MADNEVDLIDVGALVLFPIAAGMVLGVWSFSLTLFGGFDFSQALWTFSGLEISPALIAAVASIAWIVATNELDGSDYEQWEYGLIVSSFAVTPAYALIPAVETFVSQWDVAALALWLATAITAVYLSYTE